MTYLKRNFIHDCDKRNENPTQFVKWLRRNMGPRGNGWDFHYSYGSKKIWLELRDDRLIMMYEMWYGTDETEPK